MTQGEKEQDLDLLGRRPRRGDGVRRLNRVPLFIAGLMLLLILGAVTYTYQMRLAEIRRKATESETRPEPANLNHLFEDAPDGGLIPAKQFPVAPIQSATPPAEKPPTIPAPIDPYAEEWDHYRQEMQKLADLRTQRLRQAISAPTKIQTGLARSQPAQEAKAPAEALAPSPSGQLASLYATEALRQRKLASGDSDEDINRAADKRAFLTDSSPQGRGENYLAGGREAPLSPYELKAGTVIPAILIGGIDSDLPGQIMGQVTENVYDTASGRYILIPQGAKLIGIYDNSVTTGQERVLVAWTRIIFPDASSIDLGKMPGSDESGLAGLHDKVNDHFWKMFGNALLMSVFSAGIQISQGSENNGTNGLNAQQSIAAGLGQQLGQLGQEIARRNTRIQPTLEIRPGYRFTVTVTKDIVIRPWRKG